MNQQNEKYTGSISSKVLFRYYQSFIRSMGIQKSIRSLRDNHIDIT